MERRLYFLLPDVAHVKTVVAKLEINGIERKHTHVIAAKGIDLEGLPLASPNQRMDLALAWKLFSGMEILRCSSWH